MKNVKLSVSIPETLADIRLEQYQEYMKVLKTNEDTKDDEGTVDFLNLKSLQIFCGVELKESYNIPIKTFHFALEHLGRCFSEKTPLIPRWKMVNADGAEQWMGMIPKLDDMSYGEYVDLDKYISDWSQMHKAMAVFYRPIRILKTKGKEGWVVDEYEGTDRYAEAMKDMPMNIVFGAVVFFYRLGMKLPENMIASLAKEEEISNLSSETSLLSGDGTVPSMSLLRETLEDLMRCQNFHYTR